MLEALAQLPLKETPMPKTLHELFEHYKKSVNGTRLGMALLAPTTQKQYIDMIDRFLENGFGQMRLRALTAGHVTKYLSLRAEGDRRAQEEESEDWLCWRRTASAPCSPAC